MKRLNKFLCILMMLSLILAISVPALAAGGAIDTSKTGSLNLYKYDITSAAAAGAWDAGSHVTTGAEDSSVSSALGSYAIKGVKYSYIKVADITAFNSFVGGVGSSMVLYSMPSGTASEQLLSALGISYSDAHHQVENNYYFTSDKLIDALASSLSSNSTDTKNALENYIYTQGGTALPETDQYGHTSATDLQLGLYLVVETAVPQNVTSTTDPFLVSVPMTAADGSGWLYDITLYPKNNTGGPTLEKTVRESSESTGKNTGSAESITDGYAHTATGSNGDVMQYQIISTLPTITSAASQLTAYSFADNLSKGLTYAQNDVVVEFFRDAECAEKVATWNQADGKFAVNYGSSDGGGSMTISVTESGLTEINTSSTVHGTSGTQRGYSGCTMRITYTATINGDSSVVYGDSGNPNDVTLTWRRTNADYYDTLQDDCHVYVYGLDLTKEFSDGAGNYENVKMTVHNDTDDYYVQASQTEGVYYVTGRTANEEEATVFTPLEKKIVIKGLEDDAYSIKETATDEGYSLLSDSIKVVISTSEGAVCGTCNKATITASGTVNGEAGEMATDGSSAHALITLTVTNSKGFDLPQTGGNGTWIYTTIGIVLMAGAAAIFFIVTRRRPGRR